MRLRRAPLTCQHQRAKGLPFLPLSELQQSPLQKLLSTGLLSPGMLTPLLRVQTSSRVAIPRPACRWLWLSLCLLPQRLCYRSVLALHSVLICLVITMHGGHELEEQLCILTWALATAVQGPQSKHGG